MFTEKDQQLITTFLNGAKDIQSAFEEVVDLIDAGCPVPPAKVAIKKKVVKVL